MPFFSQQPEPTFRGPQRLFEHRLAVVRPALLRRLARCREPRCTCQLCKG